MHASKFLSKFYTKLLPLLMFVDHSVVMTACSVVRGVKYCKWIRVCSVLSVWIVFVSFFSPYPV